jgi:HEAT repeat protein
MRWILLVSMAAAVVSQGRAATQAQCSELLRHGLEDKNPETRKQAVVALSLAGQRGPLFARLEEMLQDKDVQVRQAVVVSLSEVKSRSATAALHKALEDEVPEVSFTAAKALWARNDPAGKQALLAVLAGDSKTSSGFFSKQKREALRMMHTPRTTFLFAVRQGARFAPVPGVGEGIASMQSILTDSQVPGRASAALLPYIP